MVDSSFSDYIYAEAWIPYPIIVMKKTLRKPTAYPASTCAGVWRPSHTRAEPRNPQSATHMIIHVNTPGIGVPSCIILISKATTPAIAAEWALIFHRKLMRRFTSPATPPPAKNITSHIGACLK